MSIAGWVILIGAALISSTISGFLGMAGGMSLLAVMTVVLPAPWVVPLHGVVQLCSNLTRTLAFLRHVRWRIFAVYAAPVALGVAAATTVWDGDKLAHFRPAIGVFILAFLIWRRFAPKLRNLPIWTYGPLGLVVGFLSIWIGATGPFLAPFFLRDDFEKEEIIATKAACQGWVHVLKIPAFLSLGFDYRPHAPFLITLVLAVIIGTYLGKWLLGKISRPRFLQLFEGVLTLIAVWLIVGGLLHSS